MGISRVHSSKVALVELELETGEPGEETLGATEGEPTTNSAHIIISTPGLNSEATLAHDDVGGKCPDHCVIRAPPKIGPAATESFPFWKSFNLGTPFKYFPCPPPPPPQQSFAFTTDCMEIANVYGHHSFKLLLV